MATHNTFIYNSTQVKQDLEIPCEINTKPRNFSLPYALGAILTVGGVFLAAAALRKTIPIPTGKLFRAAFIAGNIVLSFLGTRALFKTYREQGLEPERIGQAKRNLITLYHTTISHLLVEDKANDKEYFPVLFSDITNLVIFTKCNKYIYAISHENTTDKLVKKWKEENPTFTTCIPLDKLTVRKQQQEVYRVR